MNADVEKEIERLLENLWSDLPQDREILTDKMKGLVKWVYRDAAKICRDSLYWEDDPTELAARNIEERIK